MPQEIRGSFANLSSIIDTAEKLHEAVEKTTSIIRSPVRSPNGVPVRRCRISRHCKICRFPVRNSGANCCATAESSVSSNGSDTDCSTTSGYTQRSRNTNRRWKVNIYSDGQQENITSEDLQRLCRRLNYFERSRCTHVPAATCFDPPSRATGFTKDLYNMTTNCLSKLFQPWNWRLDKYEPSSTKKPKTRPTRRGRKLRGSRATENSSDSSYESIEPLEVGTGSMVAFFVLLLVLAAVVIMTSIYVMRSPDLLYYRSEWSKGGTGREYRTDKQGHEISDAKGCNKVEEISSSSDLIFADNTSHNAKKFEDYFRKKLGRMTDDL